MADPKDDFGSEQSTTNRESTARNPSDQGRACDNPPPLSQRANADDLYDDSIERNRTRDALNTAAGGVGAANTTGAVGMGAGDLNTTGTNVSQASTDATRTAGDATANLDPDRGADANRDPLSGAPGAHPVGVGVGAATGGAAAGAATGFAVGAVAGPVGMAVGTAIGTAVGAIAGGYAGKGIAESINPTAEDAYWRDNYSSRPYVQQGESYDEYRDAYEYGWSSRGQYADKSWDEAEPSLRSGWEKSKGGARRGWDKVKDAVKDSWDRVTGDDTNRAPGSNQSQSSNQTTRKDSY